MPPVQKANITQCYMYNTLISHYKQTMPHVQKSNITLQTNCHVYKMLLLLFGWAFTRQLTYFWRALILYNSPLDAVLSGRGLLHYHMTWRRAINDSTTTRNICNQVREPPPPYFYWNLIAIHTYRTLTTGVESTMPRFSSCG